MKILTGLLIACLVNFSIGSAPSMAAESAFIGGSIGVVDTHRHQIIPSKFSQIDYLGLGLYQTTSIDLPDQFSYGKIHEIYDHDGHLLNLKIPEGCTFDGLYWMGEKAEGKRQAEEKENSPPMLKSSDLLKYLPADALLRVKRNNYFGISDVQGNLVLEPEYGEMEKPGDGLAMVFKGERDGRYRRKDAFVFHCRDHSLHTVDSTAIFEQLEKYSDGMHKFSAQSRGVGYLDENGKIAIAAQYYDGSDFSNGTAMAVIHEGGGKFRHPQIDKIGREIAAQSPLIGEQSEQEKKVERIKSRTLADFRPSEKMNSPWVYVYKTEKDRFIEHTLEERKHFDSYAWKQKCSPDRNRKEMFGDFLQDYRLIGMSRRQVVDLLGPADVGGYQTKEDYLRYQMEPIRSGSCAQQSTTSIRIVFNTEDRVDYWYYTNGFAKTPSVKKDILLAPATYLYPMFAPGEISAVPELR